MLDLPLTYENQVADQQGLDLNALSAQPPNRRALIVDDDPESVDLIKIVIRNAGLDVFGAFSGSEALEKCTDLQPSIILLDLMMPDMDGWEIYKGLRKLTDAPVIVVSADSKKENVVRCLNLGFDDYVTKPFFPPELVARVNVVLRRASYSKPVTARLFSAIGLAIDFETHDVLLNDAPVQLSPREFSILAILARKAPRMVRYEEIALKTWNEDNTRIRNRIKYLIYLIRKKMERDPNNPELILNREGLGYQLNIKDQ